MGGGEEKKNAASLRKTEIRPLIFATKLVRRSGERVSDRIVIKKRRNERKERNG